MKTILLSFAAMLLLNTGCKKESNIVEKTTSSVAKGSSRTPPGFTKYTIKKGLHFADVNPYKTVDVNEMKFAVTFDSSAVYKSADPANQFDINKLYGFADNGANHHQFSARFGWRWSDNALRLFAYVYNDGVVASEEIGTITIGAELICSIKITATGYLFSVNENKKLVARTSTTATGIGYQLYPYFGGDEAAPHDVNILVKNL